MTDGESQKWSTRFNQFVRSLVRSFVPSFTRSFGSFSSFVRSTRLTPFPRSVHSLGSLGSPCSFHSLVHSGSFLRVHSPGFPRSFVPSLVRSFVRSFVRSLVHSLIPSLIRSLTRSSIPLTSPSNRGFLRQKLELSNSGGMTDGESQKWSAQKRVSGLNRIEREVSQSSVHGRCLRERFSCWVTGSRWLGRTQ